jgi:hypothetical protein
MKSDLTDITLVVDRSGSMAHIKGDAEGGVNTFVTEQAKEPGGGLVTLLQFDTEYAFLHRGMPIQRVPKYEPVPRRMTALLYASQFKSALFR